ncbi:hypothetical protein RHMOL_Rhmol08G0215200 [Rhododendron molle]|uniref:Uncharacterized protein n=1 Tax=Rhododendron molle TaxID=49168 RepID=A0ACC0MRM4_RHOML|nr:hypothetical protein RHMOL_Rhmol08G0215200 [Rhododendron molle]
MSKHGNYSYHIREEYFCENRPLPYDHSVRIVLQLRCTPRDDPEIRCHRFLVPGIVLVIRVNKIFEAFDDKLDDIRWAMEQLTMQVERMPTAIESSIEALEKVLVLDDGGGGGQSRLWTYANDAVVSDPQIFHKFCGPLYILYS